MLIFAGLGNPGSRYAGNRHNIGFMALDEIARRHRASPWRARFQAQASEATIGSEKIVLLKPQTYMNESGRSISEAARFFKVEPADVIVFHDELDLAPAKLRIKLGGGNAGHNGLRSTTAAIGNEYRRVRMGIGHPGLKELVHAYVLNDFGKAELPWVEDLCTACTDNAELLARHDDAGFQNKVHLFMEARGHGAVKRLGEKAAD
ncbi:aminoacyl-tRNA hydrolase [Bosea vaviloviae]|uniref:Peptidyl-tRNA hydrolase n=1 Tax=Bosea vaviloviae TaxID=1526658 RepID=A0A0N1N262_9HYPH|nr:aminoacyl-tRNA hydrolase [Bosea vaviloviae]KPH80262.1 peptidyl-tRNA hydrolase [Bosea vaviloviae]